jgi:hypothetical protein
MCNSYGGYTDQGAVKKGKTDEAERQRGRIGASTRFSILSIIAQVYSILLPLL